MTQNPTRGLALLAAALPLLCVAVMAPILGLVVDGPLPRMIDEGGWGMYLVLLFAAMGAVGAGVMMLFGAYLRFPAALAMLAAAPVWLSGVLGTSNGITGSVAAVVHASPGDRPQILLGAFAEAANCWVLGAWLSGALLLGIAGALLVLSAAAPAPEDAGRRALGVGSAVASLALAVAAGVDALRVAAVTDVYRSVAHASSPDLPTLLEYDVPRLAALDQARPLVALAAVLVGLIAVFLTARRAPGPLALGGSLAAVLGAAALAALGDVAAAKKKAELDDLVHSGSVDRTQLLVIPVGDRPFEPAVTLAGAELRAADQRYPTDTCEGVAQAMRRRGRLVLGLAADADPAALQRVLACAQREHAEDVRLVGRRYPPDALPKIPPAAAAQAVEVAGDSLGEVRLWVVAGAAGCPDCERAELRDDGVHLAGREPATLKLEWPREVFEGQRRAVLVLDAPVKPERLALAAAVLAASSVSLVVATGADDAPAQAVEGSLSKEQILAVVEEHRGEVTACFERRLRQVPELAGKLVVTWTIQPDGTVDEVSARDGGFDAEVTTCVVGRVQRWRFPKPLGGGIVKVTYPWIFKAAD